MLVCDFDETLTEKDTIGTLLSVAEEVAARVSTSALQAAQQPTASSWGRACAHCRMLALCIIINFTVL